MSIRIIAKKDGQTVSDKVYLAPSVAKRMGERLITQAQADVVYAYGCDRAHSGCSTLTKDGWKAGA